MFRSLKCEEVKRLRIIHPLLLLLLLLYEGRSIYVTNGNKTCLMDVICFLCISLGSSTVQLHDNLGSRRAFACSEAGFSSQNGDGG
jgi:hypothetical protein